MSAISIANSSGRDNFSSLYSLRLDCLYQMWFYSIFIQLHPWYVLSNHMPPYRCHQPRWILWSLTIFRRAYARPWWRVWPRCFSHLCWCVRLSNWLKTSACSSVRYCSSKRIDIHTQSTLCSFPVCCIRCRRWCSYYKKFVKNCNFLPYLRLGDLTKTSPVRHVPWSHLLWEYVGVMVVHIWSIMLFLQYLPTWVILSAATLVAWEIS